MFMSKMNADIPASNGKHNFTHNIRAFNDNKQKQTKKVSCTAERRWDGEARVSLEIGEMSADLVSIFNLSMTTYSASDHFYSSLFTDLIIQQCLILIECCILS